AYWFSAPDDYDSLKLELNMDGVTDTVFFRKPSLRLKAKRGASQAKEGKLDIKPSTASKVKHFGSYVMKSGTPISYVNLDSALLVTPEDSLPLGGFAEVDFNNLNINYEWVEGEKYGIFIPDSAVCDRYGACNDTIRL